MNKLIFKIGLAAVATLALAPAATWSQSDQGFGQFDDDDAFSESGFFGDAESPEQSSDEDDTEADGSEPLDVPYQNEDASGDDTETDEDTGEQPGSEDGDADFFDTLEFLNEGTPTPSGGARQTRAPVEEGAAGEADPVDPLDALDFGTLPNANPGLGLDEQQPSWGVAVFRGLDKVTARVWLFEAPVEQKVEFGKFEVLVHHCNKRPPEEPPNTTAFVEIDEKTAQSRPATVATVPATTDEGLEGLADTLVEGAAEPGTPAADEKRIFNGWMFAQSPGLNGVEHPVYDIWLIDCKIPPGDVSGGMDRNVEDMVDSDVIDE